MPTITLYGSKGGSGRTTSATAIAQGLLTQGCEVTLVELGSDPRSLERWFAEVSEIGDRAPELHYRDCARVADLDALKREIGMDDGRFIIIDTADAPSVLRSHAFEMADLVLMPFVGLLDARHGIACAKSQLPPDSVMYGLALRSEPDLIAAAEAYMPMITVGLPTDERFNLFSNAARELARIILTAGYDELGAHDSLCTNLSELTADIRGSACGHLHGYLPYSVPPALTQDNCALALPQW